MNDKLDKNKILSLLKTDYNIIVLDRVDSTNLYLKSLAQSGASHNTVVIADTQTNGRGRLGKSFFSPPGTGIYMSILLKADNLKIPSSHITVASGVSVCHTLEEFCDKIPSIKWVNDIFLNGKKVCGILAESFVSPIDGLLYIIVGIGINISTNSTDFPDELSDIAGSVFPAGISRNTIIAKLLDDFKRTSSIDNIDALISQYKEHSMLLNKEIYFSLNGKILNGIAADINNEGNLIVLLPDGKKTILKSGEVSLGSGNFINQN